MITDKVLGQFRMEAEKGRLTPALEVITGSGVVTIPVAEIIEFKEKEKAK